MELLQRLGEAVRRRQEIEFEYRKLEREGDAGAGRREKGEGRIEKAKIGGRSLMSSPAGEVRRVRPYHLACVGGQWYLFAYDLLRKDMRKFVPARMGRLELRPNRFERPRDFSIDKLLQGSFGIFSGEKVVPIRIWFGRSRAQVIRERRWHHSQKIKELGNGEIELTLELSSFAEIVPWILSWSEHARALAPAALAREVRAAAKRVVESYDLRH
jgi:proteasome accessory factor B